ncbi:MAG: hypothetical protein K6A79_03965 [Ruminococcus sp.]|nr:hypothetical protein [Ruminococcus sp.]
MNTKDKFVVTDEDDIVETFADEEAAREFANDLAIKNAIKDISENQANPDDEPDEKKIAEWIAFRGTVEYRPMNDEDRKDIEEANN